MIISFISILRKSIFCIRPNITLYNLGCVGFRYSWGSWIGKTMSGLIGPDLLNCHVQVCTIPIGTLLTYCPHMLGPRYRNTVVISGDFLQKSPNISMSTPIGLVFLYGVMYIVIFERKLLSGLEPNFLKSWVIFGQIIS